MQKPSLHEYLVQYTDRKIGSNRSRSKSRKSSASVLSNTYKTFITRQFEFKSQIQELKSSISPVVTDPEQHCKVMEKIETLYEAYLRDTEYARYRMSQYDQGKGQEEKQKTDEPINKDNYAEKLSNLRSKTEILTRQADLLKKQLHNQPNMHEENINLTKYRTINENGTPKRKPPELRRNHN